MSTQPPRQCLLVTSDQVPDYVAVAVPAEEGGFVITGARLTVTTQGDTIPEAMGNLAEAIGLYDEQEDERAPCPHCPDGHTPPTSGAQPWNTYVGPARDSDGQPTQIIVMRSAGAHVAESDAEWVYDVLNRPTRGRCGEAAPALILKGAPVAAPLVCCLPAGHPGWHRADDGAEWGMRRAPEGNT
ncbi:type II toxin-antitoxin system HicB family antitoxin [Nocardiopsis dassonvillei]|uniref:type II toxin-antitoxin system HicB family antitoxin n=1 Tax=Nocardiopsis dassonvillei TaxID=2014 RepID=UPI0036453EC3